MKLCGKYFSDSIIQRIQSALAENPTLSRRKLSFAVCEWMDWRSENGKLKDLSCRKALLELHRRKLIRLPESTQSYNFQKKSRPRNVPDAPYVDCDFSELGNVALEAVSADYKNREKSEIWNGLMDRFHYLGSGPLCGAQIRYLIVSEKYGYLGGLSFSSGTLRLKDRDDWIGWSESAHWANMNRVVCNSRFLILPTVNVKNLASHILSRSAKRLVRDWEERYGYRPLLLETFVDPDRFNGACYRAANWTHIGQTAGRAGRYANGKKCGSKKEIYLYPLGKKWSQILCRAPEKKLFSEPRETVYSNWREEEFGAVELHDPRLKKRLDILASDMYENPGKPIQEACGGSVPKTKAAHRFFSHKEIHSNLILRPHVEATAARIRKHNVVLAIQNSIKVKRPDHIQPDPVKSDIVKSDPVKSGLVCNDDDTFTLCDTLCFAANGTPLGVIDSQCFQSKEKKTDSGWARGYQAAAEIQEHCAATMMVCVGDLDSSVFHRFNGAGNTDGPKILVRSRVSRHASVQEKNIWKKTALSPVSGYCEVEIPPTQNRPGRKASLAIKQAKISLNGGDKHSGSISVWAIFASEIGRPDSGAPPIQRALLTNLPINGFDDAHMILNWDMMRWRAERHHRALKNISPLNDPAIQNFDGLKACLAIYMVIAWRICRMNARKQETPDILRGLFASKREWIVLRIWAVHGSGRASRHGRRLFCNVGFEKMADGNRHAEMFIKPAISLKKFNGSHFFPLGVP